MTDQPQHTCMHPGCTEREHLVQLVNLFDEGEDAPDFYCVHHVPESYCWGCGYFCAGMESFDFAVERGGIKGLCEECTEVIRADCGEDRYGNFIEDDEDWDDYPDEATMEMDEE
jgi:hypothetical protein